MMETADYGGIAALVVALQGLAEAVKLAASKLLKKKDEEARQRNADEMAAMKLDLVKVAARVDATVADVTACVARHDKVEGRMDQRDDQVRQGLDNATRTLHELALQIARSQG